MTTFVALLRAVNVAGRNQVSMAELRAIFESQGYSDVMTYIQSGNVVFGRARAASSAIVAEIEAMLARELGRPVDVVIRSSRELDTTIEANPFLDRVADTTKLHVAFLGHPPDPARMRELDSTRFAPEAFALAARDVYLHCPNGLGRSKLAAALVAKLAPGPVTVRNWNTVTKLAELASRR